METKNCNMILTEKQQKYHHYYPEKLFNMNIIQVNKYSEKAKFTYYPLGKAFEKQTEKQVDVIKSLDPSNKLIQIEGIFPKNVMNYLIRAKLKEIVELQDIIKKDDLNYKSKCRKTYNFSKYSLPIVF